MTERITRVPHGPTEGVTRCPCGVKYWHNGFCVGCGEKYKPHGCEMDPACISEARYYAGGPNHNDWACFVCDLHLPPTWRIMDRYY